MKSEFSPQTKNNSENRVANVNLAHEMAHGGKAHRELAAKAMQLGLEDEATEQNAKAEVKEYQAGKTHIDALNAQLVGGVETVLPNGEFETRVEAAKQALAEKYNLTPEDFSLVETKNDSNEPVHTVMMNTESGLDLGDSTEDFDAKRSYNGVMKNDTDKRFIVEIDGQLFDTRTLGVDAYHTFVDEQISNNVFPLPDSDDLYLWTNTLITGYGADRSGDGLLGYVYRGQSRGRRNPYGDGNRDVRFRPAVVV